MAPMGLIRSLIVGGLAGWIASMIMGTNARMGAVKNVVVGMLGGFIGGIIFKLVGLASTGFLGNILVSVVGSVVFLWIFKNFSKKA